MRIKTPKTKKAKIKKWMMTKERTKRKGRNLLLECPHGLWGQSLEGRVPFNSHEHCGVFLS